MPSSAATSSRPDETAYDRHRLRQWLAGEARADGVSRRRLLTLLAAAGTAGALPLSAPVPARAADGDTIVKPLPPETFVRHGTNAETRWEALRGIGHHTPNDLFFVRNHTATPRIGADDWRLRLWGSGLRGGPGEDRPVEFGYDDLRRLPSVTRTAFVECAGNGRSGFTTQQGETVSGTPWGLGAIGVARWRGVPLSTVLRRAGLSPYAVDVQPRGLDAEYVSGGESLGRVRRPLPLSKALHDVVLAYEMNGEPLPPDHGHPVRVLVPSWVGIASIKWVGDIEVSAQPLFSPWNTTFYRLFGPGHPEGGSAPLTRQTLKSAFELARGATFPVGRGQVLTGRSWSGAGPVDRVDVSTDGGASWRQARLLERPRPDTWTRWSVTWKPRTRGTTRLLARATDTAGRTQPDVSVHNTQGYLFDAVVRHEVTVV
ncbi:sulfite oxidase [Streptomyces cellulosae]|jgi:DMSO/TMAO reductase YedYZ molybdopterin-dependent catalytic subunit|uniref:Sulfite oxidase n=2 Tax=Streptomyces TaxID=1883 RepID=A0ABU3JDY0_9ACTN|nr:DMSO/TMAO reductase YedYZ molybdopterin-dependent catalytic subunit [Streptomyces thermodiastaticus]MDT6973271.1 sulfite oxidase [Streptomyces thermocarboxydus]MDX3417934.1 sulfite oxidase [Streptomyces sp. MD20-1-1]WSB44647.1 sulfite oxidase [Streptomyces cellulosae]UVT12832.1 sulfite oxidase [Streptomyces thermocarboxydus]